MTEDKNNNEDFNFTMPVEIAKGKKDGEWRIKGLASTEDVDLQGEIVRQHSLDITPLKEGKGLLNNDHKEGPENIVGKIDFADIGKKGLEIEGYLFQKHQRAQAFYEIMSSLKPEDKGRIGLSIEGKVLKRSGVDGRIISAARIDKVALTLDPVNPRTYAQLVKSLTAAQVDGEVANDHTRAHTYGHDNDHTSTDHILSPETGSEDSADHGAADSRHSSPASPPPAPSEASHDQTPNLFTAADVIGLIKSAVERVQTQACAAPAGPAPAQCPDLDELFGGDPSQIQALETRLTAAADAVISKAMASQTPIKHVNGLYWYRVGDGHVVASTSPDGPPQTMFTDHEKVYCKSILQTLAKLKSLNSKDIRECKFDEQIDKLTNHVTNLLGGGSELSRGGQYDQLSDYLSKICELSHFITDVEASVLIDELKTSLGVVCGSLGMEAYMPVTKSFSDNPILSAGKRVLHQWEKKFPMRGDQQVDGAYWAFKSAVDIGDDSTVKDMIPVIVKFLALYSGVYDAKESSADGAVKELRPVLDSYAELPEMMDSSDPQFRKAQKKEKQDLSKYVKRTGMAGAHKFWYVLANGHYVSSDSPDGPPHVDHSRKMDLDDRHQDPKKEKIVACPKPSDHEKDEDEDKGKKKVKKALASGGAAYNAAPSTLTGGPALEVQDLDTGKRKKKKLKKELPPSM